jgi:molybdopterin/thiamine biosynthesis adenylyltransferase
MDRVETKNTKSQFHAKTSVGKHKVMALQQLMNFCWGWKIEIVNAQLHEKNVEQLLGNADLVVDCLDNGKARRLVQGFVRAQGTPCLHGALAPDGGLGRVVWDLPGPSRPGMVGQRSPARLAGLPDQRFHQALRKNLRNLAHRS